MKGLVIWSHSYCRSTLAFYNGLGKSLACNAKIIVLKGLSEARKKLQLVCAMLHYDMEFKKSDIANFAIVIPVKENRI